MPKVVIHSVPLSDESNLRKMPIYEYQCKNCGTKHSDLRSLEQIDAPISCPKCQELGSKRLVSKFKMGRDENQRIDSALDKLNGADSETEIGNSISEIGKAMDDDIHEDLEAIYESEVSEGNSKEWDDL